MKRVFFLALLVFSGALTAVASVSVDSVKSTTNSITVFYSWDFNSPDTVGFTGVELATNSSFTAGNMSSALTTRTSDTGHVSYTFSGLISSTLYYVRPTELTFTNGQAYGTAISKRTDQIYYLPQVVIDSIRSTWNSQEIFYRYKTGNDTVHVAIKSAKNPSFTIGLNIMPDFTTPIFSDTAWVSASSVISDLQDTMLYYNEVSVSNRKGTTKDVASKYTLARPVNTPYVSSDSSSVTYTTATMYGSGWGNQGFGFKVYGSQTDANNDNNGANYAGSGSVGYFFKTISGLNSNTTKWWRSYVINNGTTVWGTVRSFVTETPVTPTIIPNLLGTSPTTAQGPVYINTNGLPAKVEVEYPVGTLTTISNGVALNGSVTVNLSGLEPGVTNNFSIIVTIYGYVTEKLSYVTTAPEVHPLDARVLNSSINTATDQMEVYFRYVSENDPAQVWVEITDDITGTPIIKWTSGYATVQTPNDQWSYGTISVARSGGWAANPGTYFTRLRGYNSNNAIETQWTSVVVVGLVEHKNQKEVFRIDGHPFFLNDQIIGDANLDIFSLSGQVIFSEKVREGQNIELLNSLPMTQYYYRVTFNDNKTESGKIPITAR